MMALLAGHLYAAPPPAALRALPDPATHRLQRRHLPPSGPGRLPLPAPDMGWDIQRYARPS